MHLLLQAGHLDTVREKEIGNSGKIQQQLEVQAPATLAMGLIVAK